MTTPTHAGGDIAGLIERLKAASGRDDALDDDIWLAVVPGASRRNVMAEWPEQRPIWEYSDPERNLIGRSLVPRLTASVDAALALVERQIAVNGRKVICFFCAGGQLTPENAEHGSDDYHPLAKIDNSATVGWMAHVAFYNADGSATGPERYSHGATAPLAILLALLTALQEQSQ